MDNNDNKSLTVQGLNAIHPLTSNFTTKLDHNLVVKSLIDTHFDKDNPFNILKVEVSLAVLDDNEHYNIDTPLIRIVFGVVRNASLLSHINKSKLIEIGFTLIG